MDPHPRSEIIANVAKGAGIFASIRQLASSLLLLIFIIIFVFLMMNGLPLYIGLPAIAILLIFMILSIIQIKRVASASYG